MRTFTSLDEVRSTVGEELGSSAWLEISQQHIDAFANATGDHHWMHVDPEWAAAGPFGTTIAHGYLTMSLLSSLAGSIFAIEGPKLTLNYGINSLRLPNPVRVGARVRANAAFTSVEETPKGVRLIITNTVEIEGENKPACVAQNVRLLIF
ncbi:MaoC family dehydratase [Williamsia muralis]|uniref:Dehydratase n=1 Tax=Williamsia marianensis TaxID=85044 RepID=A0A2G3PMI9_WILMA|nr:MaoC family dehydratase [Williamsia marianensis]PHV67059.1 dehydratase [Williamsia marianensis]